MVLKESFLCGTPAITTPIPPAKEVIRDGKMALSVKDLSQRILLNR